VRAARSADARPLAHSLWLRNCAFDAKGLLAQQRAGCARPSRLRLRVAPARRVLTGALAGAPRRPARSSAGERRRVVLQRPLSARAADAPPPWPTALQKVVVEEQSENDNPEGATRPLLLLLA
jgi:hypothetical protein